MKIGNEKENSDWWMNESGVSFEKLKKEWGSICKYGKVRAENLKRKEKE